MLHFTSWMRKLNRSGGDKSNEDDLFNFDRNHHRSNNQQQLDRAGDEPRALGYWGYLRDAYADNKRRQSLVDSLDLSDGFWGQYEDPHLKPKPMLRPHLSLYRSFDDNNNNDDDDERQQNEGEQSKNKKLFYDLKCSKFKIQAYKRDDE